MTLGLAIIAFLVIVGLALVIMPSRDPMQRVAERAADGDEDAQRELEELVRRRYP